MAIADEPMVTNWPPISIAEISLDCLAMRRLTSAARVSPAFSSANKRAREAAEKAVSAPAKNAAAIKLTTITATDMGTDMS